MIYFLAKLNCSAKCTERVGPYGFANGDLESLHWRCHNALTLCSRFGEWRCGVGQVDAGPTFVFGDDVRIACKSIAEELTPIMNHNVPLVGGD